MFTGKLYPEQISGAELLVNKRKGLLGYEQGTGKTVISLAAAEKLIELGKAKKILVLVPGAFAYQWEDAIDEFTDTKSYYITRGRKDLRSYSFGAGPYYCITPYSLFIRDFERIGKIPWDIVIADEAQAFRSNTTKTYKTMLWLNRQQNPKYRWALTGTAIGNKLEELYSIFYWIDKKFLPPWPAFEKLHIVRQNGIIWKYKNLKGLHKYLQARMDRKTHNDLKGQLPRLVHQTYQVPATKSYTEAQAELLRLLDDLASDLSFTEDGELETKRDPKVTKAFQLVQSELVSAKVDHAEALIKGILEENPKNRIVCFSRLKSPLYELESRLGDDCQLFTGDQSSEAKRASVGRILSGESRVLLSSDAGKAGLDLHFVNYAINLDVPFSYEVLDQRRKRITRASSKFDHCVVIYLVMENSVESFYFQVVTNKGRLNTAAQEGTEDEVVIRPESLRHFLGNGNSS